MSLFDETFIKFDKKEKKEYIYSSNFNRHNKEYINDLGKTFIDFLANSEQIIEVIEKELLSAYKEEKIKNIKDRFTYAQNKLEGLNPFFYNFDFDEYIYDYIKKIQDENYIKIQDYLKKIQEFENIIKRCNSEDNYRDLIMDEINIDYESKEVINAFKYIDKSQEIISKKLEKFKKKYGRVFSSPSLFKKMYNNDIDYIKGNANIENIEKRIFEENKEKIEHSVKLQIVKETNKYKKLIKSYKKLLKNRVKQNEKNIEELIKEYIGTLKFWIEFSRYILISFYNLSLINYDKNITNDKKLLLNLLKINRIYFNSNVSEIPNSNLIFELQNGKNKIPLDEFIKSNGYNIKYSNIFNELSDYKVNIVQVYSIKSIKDFINISLAQILENNIKICKCNNCNKLFISVNKSNEKYCTYQFKNGKSCRDLSYNIYLQKNELSNILRKRYRSENAKKIRNHHIPNINEKFDVWYMKAKEQKELCEKNKISIEQFEKWFEDNKKWF